MFTLEWKKAKAVLVYKRGNKENYRPISLLPICGEIFD